MSYRIPYPIGNTERRDHIQFPTILRSEIPDVFPGDLTTDERDRLWPVDITLAQAMAIAWRGRKWTLSASFSATLILVIPAVSTQSAAGSATIADTDLYNLVDGDPDEIAAADERGLIGKVFGGDLTPYKNLVNNGLGLPADAQVMSDWATSGDFFANQSGSVGIDFPRVSSGYWLYDPDTELFSPPFGTGTMVLTQGNNLLLSMYFFRNPTTFLGGTTPITLKVPASMSIVTGITDNINVPVQLSWVPVAQGVGNSLTGGGSGTLTMEATQFWPYRNKADTLPIYDEDTGAELNSPDS